MSILSGFFKEKKYKKTSRGYKLRSLWTSSNTVEMDDGSTVQESITELNNTFTNFISNIGNDINTASTDTFDSNEWHTSSNKITVPAGVYIVSVFIRNEEDACNLSFFGLSYEEGEFITVPSGQDRAVFTKTLVLWEETTISPHLYGSGKFFTYIQAIRVVGVEHVMNTNNIP